MTASVVVNLNLSEQVKRKLEAAERQAEREAVEHVALIKANVDRGKGYDGSSLKPYSDSYQAYRARKGMQASPPNLRVTGNMMQSLTSSSKREGSAFVSEIFFSGGGSGGGPSAAAKARYVTDAGFKFFGYSEQQRVGIVNRIRGALNNG